MSVKYGLLGILARQPQHGYELKRTFEQITGGFWQLNYGQIYQTLDRLEGDGFVTYTVEREDPAPERKVYAITEAGREALDAWLAHPEPRPRPLRDELFIRLAVMSGAGVAPVLELLDLHRQIYLEKMGELTRAKADAGDDVGNDVGDDAGDGASHHADDHPADPAGREPGGSDAAAALMEELLIDAALFHAEADLRWLEHCEAKLAAFARSHPDTAAGSEPRPRGDDAN